MKKISLLLILLTLAFYGCGKVSNATNPGGSYDTKTITGTLTLGSTGAEVSAQAVSDYMLWVQNRGSQRVYFTEINADGTYSLSVETSTAITNGQNFIGCIIKKDPLQFVGTVMLFPTGSTTEGNTGLNFSGDISGLNITYDTSKLRGVISPVSLPNNFSYDSSNKVRLDGNGEPVGADNAGKAAKAANSSNNSNNSVDKDQDGLPDIFDAANNGADLDNSLSSKPNDSAAFSGTLSGIFMAHNLKVDKENQSSANMVTNSAVILIEAVPVDPSVISSIAVAKIGSTWMINSNYTKDNPTLDRCPEGYTMVDTWAEHDSWGNDHQYKLFKVQDKSTNEYRWTVLFRPHNNAYNPGDIVLIKVTKTDGSYEYYWLTINFKFQSIVTDVTTWPSGNGSRNNPHVIPVSGDWTFTWQPPADETGVSLNNLEYTFELFSYDAETTIGGRRVVPAGLDVLSATISSTDIDVYTSTNNIDYIQVDITATYPFGDNSANKIYFKRSGW